MVEVFVTGQQHGAGRLMRRVFPEESKRGGILKLDPVASGFLGEANGLHPGTLLESVDNLVAAFQKQK